MCRYYKEDVVREAGVKVAGRKGREGGEEVNYMHENSQTFTCDLCDVPSLPCNSRESCCECA